MRTARIHLRKAAVFIWLWALPILCTSQSFGLVVSDEHYENQPVRHSTDGSKSTLEALENVQIFSLKDYCPTPSNQGSNASCVGWAVGYGAQTIYKAYKEKLEGGSAVNAIALSPYFVYNQIKLKDCALGAEIPDALRFIMTSGNVPNSAFTEGAGDCFYTPTSQQFLSAHDNKISDYRRIFGPDDLRAEKINSTKLALLDGMPVIIAMNVTESFFKLEKGEKMWYSELGSQNTLGAHALVVIGFDEIENAFEVMNSWGTEWADNGFAWIRYKDYEKFVNYGFSFYEGADDLLSLMINFKRKSMITKENDIQFADELFSYRDTVYVPVNTVSTQNSDYRIEITHSSNNYNLYCFNKSGSGKYGVFYKIDQHAFEQYGMSSLYGVTIPQEKNASIRLTDPESEHFIFLISKTPLSENLIRKLAGTRDLGEFTTVLSAERMLDQNSRYAYNKVGVISGLADNKVVILPVYFDYGIKP